MLKPKRSTSATASTGSLHLTPEDVQKLLSPESAGQGRRDVSERVASTYAGGAFNATESVVAEQIFRLLLRDTEVELRAMLAERLKSSPLLPRDIVITMARDVEDAVALPVLKYSEVLTEEDLLSIVEATQAVSRHVAVSQRREVPKKLTERLMATDRPEVLRSLAGNQGASLSESQVFFLRQRFKDDKAVEALLKNRTILPAAVTEKVAAALSGHFTSELTRKYEVPEAHLLSEGENLRFAATLNALRQNPTPYEMQKLLEQMHTYGRFTPEILFSALADGHIEFFMRAMAHMGGLGYNNVQTLLNDRGDLGFRAVYNKANLPAPLFSAARRLLTCAQEIAALPDTPPGEAFARQVLLRLRNQAKDHPAERLQQLLALIQPAFP